MNKDLMFSSKTDLWETPQYFFDGLDNEFRFTLDACALPENAKCERYFTPEQDGLKQEWTGTVWRNPPYGREIGKWVEKAYLSAENGGVTVVMLLPAGIWAHLPGRGYHPVAPLSDQGRGNHPPGRSSLAEGIENAPPERQLRWAQNQYLHGYYSRERRKSQ